MSPQYVDVPGYPGLRAGDDGTILSSSSGEWREVGFTYSHGKYRGVNYRRKFVFVHRLVALAFHGDPPPGAHLVRHLNGNPLDNRPSNLAWGTQQENMDDAKRLGELRYGPEHHNWKSVCVGGHPLNGYNVYVTGGRRRCRTCDRETWRRYRERQKLARSA